MCVHFAWYLFPRLDGACRYRECAQATGSGLLQADLSSCEAPVLFACAALWGVPAPGRQSSEGSPRVVSCALGTEAVLCREKAAWEVRSAEAVMVALVQESKSRTRHAFCLATLCPACLHLLALSPMYR